MQGAQDQPNRVMGIVTLDQQKLIQNRKEFPVQSPGHLTAFSEKETTVFAGFSLRNQTLEIIIIVKTRTGHSSETNRCLIDRCSAIQEPVPLDCQNIGEAVQIAKIQLPL
jgi:hypothetical protein